MTNLIRRGLVLASLVALMCVTGCRDDEKPSTPSTNPPAKDTPPATTPNMNTNSGSTQGS